MNYVAWGLSPIRKGTPTDTIESNIRRLKEYIHEVQMYINKSERTTASLKLRLEKNNAKLLEQCELLNERKQNKTK